MPSTYSRAKVSILFLSFLCKNKTRPIFIRKVTFIFLPKKPKKKNMGITVPMRFNRVSCSQSSCPWLIDHQQVNRPPAEFCWSGVFRCVLTQCGKNTQWSQRRKLLLLISLVRIIKQLLNNLKFNSLQGESLYTSWNSRVAKLRLVRQLQEQGTLQSNKNASL